MRIAIALINLDRDQTRLAHMRDQIEAAGLAFERFPAVLGLAVPDWLRPWFFDASGQPTPTLKPGEVGVYASHLALHRQLLLRDDLDALVVMEDDLAVGPALAAVLEGVGRLAEHRQMDVVRLSNPPKAPYCEHEAVAAGYRLVTYARVPNNMGCYLITRSGAEKTTRFAGLRRFAIDEDFRRPWELGLETYGVVPAPVEANTLETSSIDAMGTRALGRETAWQKFARRHRPSPAGFARQIRWQVRHLGFFGYLRAIMLTVAHSLAKRLSPRLAAQVRTWFALPGGLAR